MKKKGFTLIELLVVIAIIAMLLAILMPALGKVKKMAQRLVCGTNLKGLGNALNVYAFDYRDEFPVAGGKGTNKWTALTAGWDNPKMNWNDATKTDNVSVAASLYMLIREADVGPKSFVCKSGGEQPFINSIPDVDLVELWDFGGDKDPKGQTPAKCQSYSYQAPYIATGFPSWHYPADGTGDPANAIMADKNPWYDPKLKNGEGTADTYLELVYSIYWKEDGEEWQRNRGNSAAHDREGQNVLFGDNHMSFEKRPDVAARYDNIYVPFAGSGPGFDEDARRKGGTWTGIDSSAPKSSTDSNLVNDDVLGK